ncbi:hypothetical protein FQN54_007799 [Arachnomyces sp. PD_36]|nr:hypothetical protein FQN54_007799 [Arachnomyces sp. PD_36]
MKLVAYLSLLAGAVVAQEVKSDPFNLVIESDDKKLDGQQLVACHTGAAIESLCLYGDTGSEFYVNTTKGSQSPLDGYDPSGKLIWDLPLGNETAPSPMSFWSDPSTNVALPLLQPGYDAQYVSFGEEDRLAIISYLDDTKTPPTGDSAYALKNWYVCQSYFSGYQYQTLNWVFGNAEAKPQNPSCVKVDVVREFI